MVKFILGKLFAFFLLSVHTRSGAQRESDTKGWEKHLCVPVRQGKHVCVGDKWTVLRKRRDSPYLTKKKKKKRRGESLDLVHPSMQPFEEARSRWLDMSSVDT